MIPTWKSIASYKDEDKIETFSNTQTSKKMYFLRFSRRHILQNEELNQVRGGRKIQETGDQTRKRSKGIPQMMVKRKRDDNPAAV